MHFVYWEKISGHFIIQAEHRQVHCRKGAAGHGKTLSPQLRYLKNNFLKEQLAEMEEK